jgi:hypothetical protein
MNNFGLILKNEKCRKMGKCIEQPNMKLFTVGIKIYKLIFSEILKTPS